MKNKYKSEAFDTVKPLRKFRAKITDRFQAKENGTRYMRAPKS